jgi:hypothetical protein
MRSDRPPQQPGDERPNPERRLGEHVRGEPCETSGWAHPPWRSFLPSSSLWVPALCGGAAYEQIPRIGSLGAPQHPADLGRLPHTFTLRRQRHTILVSLFVISASGCPGLLADRADQGGGIDRASHRLELTVLPKLVVAVERVDALRVWALASTLPKELVPVTRAAAMLPSTEGS